MDVVLKFDSQSTMKEIMNVALAMQWEEFVKEKVSSGRYESATDVLQDGLRLLKQRDAAFRNVSPQNEEELEQMLDAGVKELDAGRGIPGDVAMKIIRERAAARRRG